MPPSFKRTTENFIWVLMEGNWVTYWIPMVVIWISPPWFHYLASVLGVISPTLSLFCHLTKEGLTPVKTKGLHCTSEHSCGNCGVKRKERWACIWRTWIPSLTLPWISCLALGEWFSLSGNQFPYLWKERAGLVSSKSYEAVTQRASSEHLLWTSTKSSRGQIFKCLLETNEGFDLPGSVAIVFYSFYRKTTSLCHLPSALCLSWNRVPNFCLNTKVIRVQRKRKAKRRTNT